MRRPEDLIISIPPCLNAEVCGNLSEHIIEWKSDVYDPETHEHLGQIGQPMMICGRCLAVICEYGHLRLGLGLSPQESGLHTEASETKLPPREEKDGPPTPSGGGELAPVD